MMKKLIVLALILALLALPFAALAEDNYEAANYEILKQVMDALELDYEVIDEYKMTSVAIPAGEDFTENIYVEGFAWDTAVEFDAYYDFSVPEDRIVEVSVLLTWLNYERIWQGRAYLNRKSGEVGFNAMTYSGEEQPANAAAVQDTLYTAAGNASYYGAYIYRVAVGGEDAETVIAEIGE